MKKLPRSVVIVNVCGAIGYMLLLAVWVLFVAVLVALLLDSSTEVISTESVDRSEGSGEEGSNLVVAVAGYLITTVVVLVSIGILLTLPYFIARWESRMLRAIMRACRIDITKRQLFFVKCLTASLPLIGLLIMNGVILPEGMLFAAVYGATVASAVISIGIFFVQLWLARRFAVPVEHVW